MLQFYPYSAICTSPCQNGGTCSTPNTCTCNIGWTGMQCETGIGCVYTCLDRLHSHIIPKWNECDCNVCSVLYNFYCLFPAIGCGDPGTPTNGQRALFSTTTGSVVTYTCDVGYTLQGSNSRTCQSNGQWNGSVPQCERMLNVYACNRQNTNLDIMPQYWSSHNYSYL